LTGITLAAQKDIKVITDQVMVVVNHHSELNELMRHEISDAPTWAHAKMYFEAIVSSFDQENEKLSLLLSDYEVSHGKDLKSLKIKKLVAEQDEQFQILVNGYKTYKVEKSKEDKRK
jgi:hypothetical protein